MIGRLITRASRSDKELFHHEGHEEHEGVKGIAHRTIPTILGPVSRYRIRRLIEFNPFGSDSPPLGAVLLGTPLDTPSACGGVVHSLVSFDALRGESFLTSGLASQPTFIPYELKNENEPWFVFLIPSYYAVPL